MSNKNIPTAQTFTNAKLWKRDVMIYLLIVVWTIYRVWVPAAE